MTSRRSKNRKGAVAALMCFLFLPLLALLALSVDYGFLLYIRTDLQRVADQAVVAGVRDLIPDETGFQDVEKVKRTIREYIEKNMGDDFEISDSDIEIGRYDSNTIYSSVDILNTGTYDTVRISLRRDDLSNQSVSLFFARLFDSDNAEINVTATGVLQRAKYLGPGTSVLPIGIEQKGWNRLDYGDNMTIYGDGRLTNSSGNPIPGNFGTMDIGPTSNGTSQLRDQTVNGLSQNDLDSLAQQGTIPSSEHIDASTPMILNGDPGFSAGLKHGVAEVTGQTKIIPIFNQVSGNGNNAYFEIIGWAGVQVIDYKFAGSSNSYIEVKKTHVYDKNLLPNPDLSDQSNSIEGAYTSPSLIQ